MQEKESPKKKSRFVRYSAYLYLALALLIVGVATASIFMLKRAVSDLPEVSIPEMSYQPEPFTPKSRKEVPVYAEESGVAETPSEQPDAPKAPVYKFPLANGEISKRYSADALVFSETMHDYRVHTGIDLASPLGAEVFCYTDGIIESVKQDDFYGMTVTVKHDYGLVTVYKNLNTMLPPGIVAGRAIKAGNVLGYVGSTAIVEGSEKTHLHFEMLVNGSYIDPEKELFD